MKTMKEKNNASGFRMLPHYKGFNLLDKKLLNGLLISGYTCDYCTRSLPSHKAQLAPRGVSCGCHMIAEYVEKKGIDNGI